ncbi:lasso peptide biosynthesis B2 protein [Phenylobacterium sp. J367]|uniref:lasso peptide biosynthesis B2 protein n=1 Tax=Phenylobacterium sp. J367 TaxID=2898435 RepID=UPI002151B6B8|nr:lasso peptide biosynthesis B2 protein [Phenylobacterium sp. J367]MCR5879455.1 lasso peptide biosynthesis B2 protein [Phenylobacterium sp. J367]
MQLAPHVHAAVIGDDVVLLDIETDAYFCLPEGRSAIGLQPDRRRLRPTPDAAEMLESAGYLSAVGEARSPFPPPVRRDLLSTEPPSLRPRDLAALAGCAIDLATRYRGQPLSRVLKAAAKVAPLAEDQQADADLVALCARFRHAAIWLPAPGKCLARSFLLLRFLQRAGRNARWVFGVRTWPFGAHCWLQVGDTALDEATDLVGEYTPIFVLG